MRWPISAAAQPSTNGMFILLVSILLVSSLRLCSGELRGVTRGYTGTLRITCMSVGLSFCSIKHEFGVTHADNERRCWFQAHTSDAPVVHTEHVDPTATWGDSKTYPGEPSHAKWESKGGRGSLQEAQEYPSQGHRGYRHEFLTPKCIR